MNHARIAEFAAMEGNVSTPLYREGVIKQALVEMLNEIITDLSQIAANKDVRGSYQEAASRVKRIKEELTS